LSSELIVGQDTNEMRYSWRKLVRFANWGVNEPVRLVPDRLTTVMLAPRHFTCCVPQHAVALITAVEPGYRETIFCNIAQSVIASTPFTSNASIVMMSQPANQWIVYFIRHATDRAWLWH
jgi:hypothetical protein